LRKIILSLLSISSLIFSYDNIWSQTTPTMDRNDRYEALREFNQNEFKPFEFKDDKKELTVYGFQENMFVVGLEVAGIPYSEKLSNKTGTKNVNLDSYHIQFTLGKDFTLWHKEYTQLSRLYLTYTYTILDSNVKMNSWSFGLRENMKYYSFYETKISSVYPTFSIEIGKSFIHRDTQTIHGLKSAASIGLTYSYKDNFEYFVNLLTNYTNWKHPVDGISDQMNGFGLGIGINYKIMYGDF